MADIHLDAHLVHRLERLAAQRSLPLDRFLDEALTAYLRQSETQELQANIRFFQDKLVEFSQAYPGEYVAIYSNQLVDHDPDFQAIHRRIRQRFGRQPVLIRCLAADGERVLTFRSPHFERATS